MTDDGEWRMSEAFTESENDADNQQCQLSVRMAPLREEDVEAAYRTQQSVLQTTLGIASSAASVVFYPYVAAGKAAAHVTSMAVSAPVLLGTHVRASIAQSWATSLQNHEEKDTADCFGQHSSTSSSSSSLCSDDDQMMELFDPRDERQESGLMSQLLYLPVRLVHSSVSTAVAIPTRVVNYSGRKISEAVSSSHQLATSAVVASTEAVTRTGMHVARGISQSAVSTVSYTAATISGAVGASIRIVSYAIPPSVSNAVWKGVDMTGNASVNVLSNAIAVPSYRMLKALLPGVETYFSEDEAVTNTRAVVTMLVKVLGPQNAIYLLKWIYDTVTSDEAHDVYLLCHDVLHESLDGDNYRHAGASVCAATGFTKVLNVMQEAYSVLPSLDEMLDAAVLLADVSDEVVEGAAYVGRGKREFDARNELRKEETSLRFEYVDDMHGSMQLTEATFEPEEKKLSVNEELNPIFDTSISLLTRVCDSEGATSFFNAFGEVLDILLD